MPNARHCPVHCFLSSYFSGHYVLFFFFSSRRRHTRFDCDWSSDVCSSDLRGRVSIALRLGLRWGIWLVVCCSGGWGRGSGRNRGGRGSGNRRGSSLAGIRDRESGGVGKRVEFGGCRIIKKKKKA